jgi:methylmalonyl-CoA/ethylmalonyl-CoA epimerase
VITRVHHVAMAVRELDGALAFWRDTLGLPLRQAAEVPEQRVRAALLGCGPCEIELVAPTAPDTGVARFLERRGEALHHVCFESDDVEREVRRFVGTGVDMIDGKPRPGLAGQIAFVHPRACAGLLVEIATPRSAAVDDGGPLALVAAHAKVDDVRAAAQRYQDLFGLAPARAADDGSFVQLTLGDVTLQLTPLGGGVARPALTALRMRADDLDGVARRLENRGVACQRSAVGLALPIGLASAAGAALIIQPS